MMCRERVRKRTPMGWAICLALAALWVPGPGWSVETFALPPIAPVEEGEYAALDAKTGADLWREQWTVKGVSQDGQTTVRVEENGKGMRGSTTPTTWTIRMRLDHTALETRFSSTQEIRDLSGQLLTVRQRELDFTGGSGRITTTDARTGKAESRDLSLPPYTISVETLAMELRALPDKPGQQMRFNLVTIDGKQIEMLAKIVGREQVTVPAGSFDCYKVEVSPTGVVGFIAGLIMPNIYMWHTVAPPHLWVKYLGPGEGSGPREVLRQLVRFTPPPREREAAGRPEDSVRRIEAH